jgi:subtilase family serine protease
MFLKRLAAALAFFVAVAAAGAAARHARPAPRAGALRAVPAQARSLARPLPTSGCLSALALHCYSPAQLEAAYDLAPLRAAGITGAGQTIAIVDSFGSPTIAKDLHRFDQIFGVANPFGIPVDPAIAKDPKLRIIHPAGKIPKFNPRNSDMVGWAEETTLDVEWAHVVAPAANILLVETPVSETEGVHGFPQIVKAENYVIDHHLASVISQSFGATENTLTRKQLLGLRSAFKLAAKKGVTVVAASGDTGSTDYRANGQDLFTFPVNGWPSSDPLVTSVGGTQLNLDDTGERLAPDIVWNDGRGAGGGGPSRVFARPAFQGAVASVVGARRGTPDISLSAAVDGGVWILETFSSAASPYHVIGGTSEAAPEFAGIVALADQLAGKPLGWLNPTLYALSGPDDGIVDVIDGDNDIGPFRNADGSIHHVAGFSAATGYDLASGLGTIDAAKFVPALVQAKTGR